MVDHVTSMDLKEEGSPGGTYAEQLLQMNYAVQVSESLCSKEDNVERQKAKNSQRYHPNK